MGLIPGGDIELCESKFSGECSPLSGSDSRGGDISIEWVRFQGGMSPLWESKFSGECPPLSWYEFRVSCHPREGPNSGGMSPLSGFKFRGNDSLWSPGSKCKGNVPLRVGAIHGECPPIVWVQIQGRMSILEWVQISLKWAVFSPIYRKCPWNQVSPWIVEMISWQCMSRANTLPFRRWDFEYYETICEIFKFQTCANSILFCSRCRIKKSEVLHNAIKIFNVPYMSIKYTVIEINANRFKLLHIKVL